jgi:hypothetical protein
MTGLYRPAGAVVEFGGRAVVEGIRTLAAHFIQTVSHFGFFGSEFQHEFVVFEMRASLALIVNGFSISEQGPS